MREKALKEILAISPSLALTHHLIPTLMIAGSYFWIMPLGLLSLSLLRPFFIKSVHPFLALVLFSFFTLSVKLFYQAYFPLSQIELFPYLELVIVSCLFIWNPFFETEKKQENRKIDFWFEGLGTAFRCSLFLILIALIRELFGFGTIFNLSLLEDRFQMAFLAAPTGAFLLAGMIVFVSGLFKKDQKNHV